jgi:WD40 repeat protein
MPGLIERQVGAPAIPQIWQASLDESAVSVDWSASGSWLAAASASGTVCIFDAVDGSCIQELSAHRFGAAQVAWHPQDTRFATAGQDGFVRLWDARLDGLVNELDCGAEWVEHIAWSENGRLLATAAGRKLKVWTKDGTLVQEYRDHPNTIAAIAWRSGSEELVSACYGQLQFWTPDDSRAQRIFEWKGSMLSLAWSPDGRYLCHGNQDATVHFWIVKTGKELQMWGYPTKIRELAWDHRSRYLATGGGPAITVWDCSGKGPANTKPATLDFHRAPVTGMAYQHSGGTLASGCAHGRVVLWKPSKRKEPDAAAVLSAGITDISWSPDDRSVAAAAEDGSVVVFCYPEKSS